MKHLVFTLLALLAVCGTTRAQRLQVGLRGGANLTDYHFSAVEIDGTRFSPGSTRAGFGAGFVVRLNLTKHLNLQSELDYDFVNYAIRAESPRPRNIRIRAERLEVPVQLGLQFGALRLFGGAAFRLTDSEHSSAPDLLRVRFDRDAIAVMGGIGLNIRHFFLDLRVQGYPRSRVWNTFISGGEEHRVRISRDIVYGASMGFFF